jgi:hypothetical protein
MLAQRQRQQPAGLPPAQPTPDWYSRMTQQQQHWPSPPLERQASDIMAAAAAPVTAPLALGGMAMQGAMGNVPGQDPQYLRPTIEDTAKAAGNMAMLGMGAARPGAFGIFGGQGAKTADLAALARATKMEREGAAAEDIHGSTGWFRGADNKWRFEIPDYASRMTGAVRGSLGMQFEHPELYAAYPGIAQSKLSNIASKTGIGPGVRGMFDPSTNEISVSRTLSPEDQRSTVLHELQHAVQEREGFTGGGGMSSPEVTKEADAALAANMQRAQDAQDQAHTQLRSYIDQQVAAGRPRGDIRIIQEFWKQNPELKKQLDDANEVLAYGGGSRSKELFSAYQRLAGEVEARNVQTRRDIPPDQLRNLPPSTTEDVARERQIVKPTVPVQGDLPLERGPQMEQEPPAWGSKRSSLGAPVVMPKMGAVPEPNTADWRRLQNAVNKSLENLPPSYGPMDLSKPFTGIPNVPQYALPLYEPPRGVPAALQEALSNPKVIRGVMEGIDRGIAQGAHNWYNSGENIRQNFVNAWGSEPEGNLGYNQFSNFGGASSPMSNVPSELKEASYYYNRLKQGLPLDPGQNPPPWGGGPAGQSHRESAQQLMDLYRQNPGRLIGPEEVWDPFDQPKRPRYALNKQGNLMPVAVDEHAYKAPLMLSENPRFLATDYRAILGPGNKPAAGGLMEQYMQSMSKPNKKGEVYGIFNPRELVEAGKIPMKQALQEPTLWEGAPAKNEYGALERFYGGLGAQRNLLPAQSQSSGWVGNADLTGLGTEPWTLAELLNRRLEFTARMYSMDPKRVMHNVFRGNMPMLGLGGGAVAAPMLQQGLGGGMLEQQ